jgi:hypothetical protein
MAVEIKTAAALMAFAVTTTDGQQWMRLFTDNDEEGPVWMKQVGEGLIVAEEADYNVLEPTFMAWCISKKKEALGELPIH